MPWIHPLSALAAITGIHKVRLVTLFAKELCQLINDCQARVVGGIIGEMLALHTVFSRVGPAWCLDPGFSFRRIHILPTDA